MCMSHYEPKSNGPIEIERSIQVIEEGLRIELMSGTPPQETIHIVIRRLNKATQVSYRPDSDLTPRDVIVDFLENNPFITKITS
jgi:hypothetical protein